MTILWIIEKPGKASIGRALEGEFPIRKFASLKSFLRLRKIHHKEKPKAILVDMEVSNLSFTNLDQLLECTNANAKRIYCNMEKKDFRENRDSFLFEDEFSFNSIQAIIRILDEPQKQNDSFESCIRYKSVELNLERLSLENSETSLKYPLSVKETRILKLLIEKAESCVTRENIKDEVWRDLVVSRRTIDSHVSRLRRKINNSGVTVDSVYGGGYILRTE